MRGTSSANAESVVDLPEIMPTISGLSSQSGALRTSPTWRMRVRWPSINSATSDRESHFSQKTGVSSKSVRASLHSVVLDGPPRQPSCWTSIPRSIVDRTWFVAATTIVTVYALIGDDVRLLLTERPWDPAFNVLTIVCSVVFTVEIVLCTLGKDDYFLSFFFLLDVVATITLFLDLSWVNDLLLMEDEEELDNVRGSRTARLGARAARIVRVVRLVRIFKLYKLVLAAQHGGPPRTAAKSSPGRPVAHKLTKARSADPGDDEYWEKAHDEDLGPAQESRVGKKLSELTTRRVICLVLVMMLVLPLLRVDVSAQLPASADYAADVVHHAFLRVLAGADRSAYERAFLHLVYYHNWFAQFHACERQCPGDYDSHVYWVGIVSRNLDRAQGLARVAELPNATVRAWESELGSGARWIYNFQGMPLEAQTAMSHWDRECDTRLSKYRRSGFSLIGELISGQVTYAVACPEDLRRVERRQFTARLNVTVQALEDWHFVYYFDVRPFQRRESVFSLGITAFVCVALTSASLLFSSDANRLVLYPVENMILKVDIIRSNPLLAVKVADEEFKVEELRRTRQRKPAGRCQVLTKALCDVLTCSTTHANELLETVILEKTIIKLGTLLALGFGEAGASIIEHNMLGMDSACVEVVEGTRVDCVIGATRIRDFSVVTEVLQGHVMTFVNRIAEIVHGVVDEFHGAANRNNGDTFLIIWRAHHENVRKLADMALVAFTRVLAAVHRSPVLASYRTHPGLQQRLGGSCRVNLNFGLHYGWAIEGAVGSEFKIDASYLSPNVSVAESVERATQVYRVSILVTEAVVRICSPTLAAKCRLIDRVILPGSASPMELHVVDADHTSLAVDEPPPLKLSWTSRQRYRARQFLEAEKAAKWHRDVHMGPLFEQSHEIVKMRACFTQEFAQLFNMGYQNYAQGEWQVAHKLLLRTKSMLGLEDGPSAALLLFMSAPHQYHAPERWAGVRTLDPQLVS